MARRDPLGVWLYGTRVAELTSTRPGAVRCTYTAEALDRWPLNTPLLSCSLPLSTRTRQAGAYCSGLLPEGQHRQAMADAAGVPTFDTFGMLARFGRDVAGAAVIGASSPEERPGHVEPYAHDELAGEVAALPDHPLGLHEDSELSIAGIQDKLLLVDLGDGRWGRPVHGRASTHILKVEDRRFPGMAEMEAACLHLAAAAGLTTVAATTTILGNLPCMIVSRFDRRWGPDGDVERVHQEDACQALGRDPDANQRRGKYEAAGGPALIEIAQLLDQFAADPMAELVQLVRVATFTVLIGNADAHGKNVSLLHPSPEQVTLAPLYDTVPTVLWPSLRTDAAMSVAGVTAIDAIRLDDVVAEARRWTLADAVARDAAADTAATVAAACADPSVPDRLAELVTSRCATFTGTHPRTRRRARRKP
jgi:serine/threonine-protein kinase HipA